MCSASDRCALGQFPSFNLGLRGMRMMGLLLCARVRLLCEVFFPCASGVLCGGKLIVEFAVIVGYIRKHVRMRIGYVVFEFIGILFEKFVNHL